MTKKISGAMITGRTIHILGQRFPSIASMEGPDIAMDNISAWDSLAQVEVILAIEKEFGIEATAELVEARSFTGLVDAITTVLAADQRLIS
jgi:acyl carrier protein